MTHKTLKVNDKPEGSFDFASFSKQIKQATSLQLQEQEQNICTLQTGSLHVSLQGKQYVRQLKECHLLPFLWPSKGTAARDTYTSATVNEIKR